MYRCATCVLMPCVRVSAGRRMCLFVWVCKLSNPCRPPWSRWESIRPRPRLSVQVDTHGHPRPNRVRFVPSILPPFTSATTDNVIHSRPVHHNDPPLANWLWGRGATEISHPKRLRAPSACGTRQPHPSDAPSVRQCQSWRVSTRCSKLCSKLPRSVSKCAESRWILNQVRRLEQLLAK